MTILAGDIGGTNARLGLYGPDGSARFERSVPNREFPSFDAALARFLADAPPGTRVSSAAIAVAGPVLDGHVQMTNIGWSLDERALSRVLGGAPVRLLNDLEAAAYGVLHLPDDEVRVLAAGAPPGRANVAVIGAGTGLGEAVLTWCGDAPRVIASEGGHADFAPHDATEFALLEWLGRSHEHVSWEHVLSGPGLVSLYQFLRDTGRGDEPAALRARLDAAVEPAQVITQSALAGDTPLCVRTLEMFVRAYGAEAGNLALKGMTLAGVYVTGGIAPDVLVGAFAERFMRAFVAKGRWADLMRRIPVRVVLCEKAPLMGACAVARAA